MIIIITFLKYANIKFNQFLDNFEELNILTFSANIFFFSINSFLSLSASCYITAFNP